MEMIREALASKTKKLILDCEACARCEGEAAAKTPESKKPAVRMMRCPEAGCWGWVGRFEEAEGTYFMCGVCGGNWGTVEQLDQAIDRILERFDHRLCCYRMVDNHWIAAPEEQEVPKLEELIGSEI